MDSSSLLSVPHLFLLFSLLPFSIFNQQFLSLKHSSLFSYPLLSFRTFNQQFLSLKHSSLFSYPLLPFSICWSTQYPSSCQTSCTKVVENVLNSYPCHSVQAMATNKMIIKCNNFFSLRYHQFESSKTR